jgi:hypothetical protein
MLLTITRRIGVRFLVESAILIYPFTTKQMSLQKEIGYLGRKILSIKFILTVINLKSTKCLLDLLPKISKSKIGKSFKLIPDISIVILLRILNDFNEKFFNCINKIYFFFLILS